MGPLPEANRCNKHILVLPNGIHEAFPTPNQKASTVTKILVDGVLNHFRPLQILHESTLMHKARAINGNCKTRPTAYQPQCDEEVERQHRTLQEMSAAFCNKHDNDRDYG